MPGKMFFAMLMKASNFDAHVIWLLLEEIRFIKSHLWWLFIAWIA